jgi:Na+-driven multidrug efflux pump
LVGKGEVSRARNLTKVIEIASIIILISISLLALIFKNFFTTYFTSDSEMVYWFQQILYLNAFAFLIINGYEIVFATVLRTLG